MNIAPEPDSPFLDAANRIGLRLCRGAIWADGRCNWLGWSLENSGRSWTPAYRSLNATLFDGVAGIALFLARLSRLTREPVTSDTVVGALSQVRRMAADVRQVHSLGFHTGAAGIAHVLLEVGELLEDDESIRCGVDLLSAIGKIKLDATKLDVTGGSAGVIPILVHEARRRTRNDLLDIAVRHGDHLLSQARRGDDGWTWNTTGLEASPPLLGYAHGVAGIVCALLELHHATDDDRYRQAAVEGLRYERSRFDPQQRNWPYTFAAAPSQPGGQNLVAWCHGAPGIGLSRLRMRQLLAADDQLLDEIHVAGETTVATLNGTNIPGYGNFSLYHGAGGCAEFLLTAGCLLNQPEFRTAAEAVGNHGIAHFNLPDMPWPCGSIPGRESPTLMLGLAGIGHLFLRLHAPRIVPSVLLAMPIAESHRDRVAHPNFQVERSSSYVEEEVSCNASSFSGDQ